MVSAVGSVERLILTVGQVLTKPLVFSPREDHHKRHRTALVLWIPGRQVSWELWAHCRTSDRRSGGTNRRLGGHELGQDGRLVLDGLHLPGECGDQTGGWKDDIRAGRVLSRKCRDRVSGLTLRDPSLYERVKLNQVRKSDRRELRRLADWIYSRFL